jgi:hypothetical protein
MISAQRSALEGRIGGVVSQLPASITTSFEGSAESKWLAILLYPSQQAGWDFVLNHHPSHAQKHRFSSQTQPGLLRQSL